MEDVLILGRVSHSWLSRIYGLSSSFLYLPGSWSGKAFHGIRYINTPTFAYMSYFANNFFGSQDTFDIYFRSHNQIGKPYTCEKFIMGFNGRFNHLCHFLMVGVWLNYESKRHASWDPIKVQVQSGTY